MLSILMPVYNERERVQRAIAAVVDSQLPLEWELVIVNDGSTDGTTEILRDGEWDPRIRILEHERNRGKGAAVRTGLRDARGEFTCIFDADLEYDPRDLAKLVRPLVDGATNACFGVRAFDGYTSHSFMFVMGNKGVTLVCNLLFNVYLKDIMTCHKVIRTELFRGLGLHADGFTIEPEITARLLQHGERIYEIPVSYRARSNEEGKKLTARDGVRVLMTLLRCRFGAASDPGEQSAVSGRRRATDG